MITKIPEAQLCEAFDPMMFLPEKTLNIIGATENANPSCVAPAFVYIEGSHGKKFLCDFHYFYEINMTRSLANTGIGLPWESVQEFIIDERERVKETFAKDVTTTATLGHKCSIFSTHKPDLKCTAEALVKVTHIDDLKNKINFIKIIESDESNEFNSVFYCNFHFRKIYYRYYSHGVKYENLHHIIDERSRMNITIAQESLDLTCV